MSFLDKHLNVFPAPDQQVCRETSIARTTYWQSIVVSPQAGSRQAAETTESTERHTPRTPRIIYHHLLLKFSEYLCIASVANETAHLKHAQKSYSFIPSLPFGQSVATFLGVFHAGIIVTFARGPRLLTIKAFIVVASLKFPLFFCNFCIAYDR